MTSFGGPLSRALRSLLLVWLLVAPGVSHAWQETTVLGHRMRVRLEADSEAVVSHELLVKIRGGPVKALPLAGVDADAEILPDATVRMAQNTWNQWPLAVTARPDGSLDLNIVATKGLRGGTYLFSMSYRTSLKGKGRIQEEGDRLIIAWVGPRLDNGIDTVRLTFDLPKAALPPGLPEGDEGTGALAILEQVRRGERDEVDLVRAHVARGEPTLWQVSVGRDALGRSRQAIAAEPVPLSVSSRPRSAVPLELWFGAALGALLAALTLGKARDLSQRTVALGATVRPLIPVPALLRAALCWTSFAAAAYFGGTEEPLAAAGLLAIAIFAGAYLAPVRAQRPRGPGVWHVVPGEALEQLKPRARGCFDVSSLGGFILFLSIALGLGLAAYRTLPDSPYRALLLLGSVMPFAPLFLTGRLSDFPVSPLTEGRGWARYLKKELRKQQGVRLTLWGRYPVDSPDLLVAAVDETRLRIDLKLRVPGLKAFEVAFEEGPGRLVLPCLLIRLLEDSEARRRLRDREGFMRGRDGGEQVLIVRPSVPTPGELAKLIVQLSAALSQSGESEGEMDSPSRAPKSGGRGDRALNTGASLEAT